MRILCAIASLSIVLGQVPQVPPANAAKGSPASAVPIPEGVKLGLSEVEDLQKQVLKLKREVLQCQIQPAQNALSRDVRAYVDAVMKAHSNPAFHFDPETFEFVPNPEPKDKPKN